MSKHCIDPARVPCDRARAYLEKKGLLCGTEPSPSRKKPKKRGLWQEWFG